MVWALLTMSAAGAPVSQPLSYMRKFVLRELAIWY
jgi:hypothetical protein